MKRLLLTVEDTFQVTGRGLVVVPGPLLQEFADEGELDVELRKPDGSCSQGVLSISYVFQRPSPKVRRWTCTFTSLSRADVPVGTQIWY